MSGQHTGCALGFLMFQFIYDLVGIRFFHLVVKMKQ